METSSLAVESRDWFGHPGEMGNAVPELEVIDDEIEALLLKRSEAVSRYYPVGTPVKYNHSGNKWAAAVVTHITPDGSVGMITPNGHKVAKHWSNVKRKEINNGIPTETSTTNI